MGSICHILCYIFRETPITFSTLVVLSAEVATVPVLFTDVLEGYGQPDNGKNETSADHVVFWVRFDHSTRLPFRQKKLLNLCVPVNETIPH